MSISPSVAVDNIEQSFMPISNGKTLYVGGSGEGNYTKIKDAIKNASDGDIVFVYDDSSPYYENIEIHEEITIKGENKETTIIVGNGKDDVVYIDGSGIKITGFTIQNATGDIDSGILRAGVLIYCNQAINNISNNIIIDNCVGVGICDAEFNYVYGNTIDNNEVGIFITPEFIPSSSSTKHDFQPLGRDWNNNICKNNVTNNGYGIYLSHCSHNNVYQNNVTKNRVGIDINGFYGMGGNNEIFFNIIMKNKNGISISGSADSNNISQNNFIKNARNARDNCKNHWDANYWDNWLGHKIKLRIFQRFPKIIFGFLSFNIDWFPAKEPYQIGV